MKAAVVYYTDGRLGEPLLGICQRQLRAASPYPIVCVSLKHTAFGDVRLRLDRQPSAVTLYTQILAGLEAADADVVYLCEHDVLYHRSHFAPAPFRPDAYCYNVHVWRWDYPSDRAITYPGLRSLSGLCASRDLLLAHYRLRLRRIAEEGLEDGRDPQWARRWGYEPGKAVRRGGLADEPLVDWRSEYPNVDVRHQHTLTPRKVTLAEFRHPPREGWQEAGLDWIPGWTLKAQFGLEACRA